MGVKLLTIVVVLHGLSGHEIDVTVEHIVSMRAADELEKNKYLAEAVKCLINTSDGKFVSVVETCEQVRRAIEVARQGRK